MQNKKVLKIIIGIVVTILLGIFLYFGAKFYLKLKIGKEISDLLQPILTEENQSMHMDIVADFAKEPFLLDSDIYKIEDEELQYLVFEQMDFPVYIVENLLLLENGNAFKIAEAVEETEHNYDDLFVQIAAAYEIFNITCEKTKFESKYSINVTGEDVQALLAKVMPAEREYIEHIEKLQVVIVAQNAKLDRIKMTGKAEAGEKSVQIDISEFRNLEPGKYEIPEAVKHAVESVDRDTLFNLTKDLYRIIAAFNQFQQEASKDGTVTIHAKYGAVDFTNTFDLAIFQKDENTSMNMEEIENLPAMIGVLCMEGEIRCVESTEGYEYTLSLDEESMQKITGMVIPEVVNYVLELTDGIAKVDVIDNRIATIEISIKGNMNIIIKKIPMEVAVKFQYE